jgi:hypothetical protein
MTAALTAAAGEIMTRAARRRLEALGWQPDYIAADAEPIAHAVLEAAAEVLDTAFGDAREAIAAGMPAVAEQTFKASLVLAGIEAANRHHAATRGAAADVRPIRAGVAYVGIA